MSDVVTKPTLYNIVLTSADTEYTQLLPSGTKELRFRCRTSNIIRFAFVTGKVAGPTANYLTLPAGTDYFSDENDLTGLNIYFASSSAGVIVELEVWT